MDVDLSDKDTEKVLVLIIDLSGSMDQQLVRKICMSLYFKLVQNKMISSILVMDFDGKSPAKFIKSSELQATISKLVKKNTNSYILPALKRVSTAINNKIKVNGLVIISDFDIFDMGGINSYITEYLPSLIDVDKLNISLNNYQSDESQLSYAKKFNLTKLGHKSAFIMYHKTESKYIPILK